MTKSIKHIILILIVIAAINYLSWLFNFRIDLTSDKRFTLNEATKNIVKDANAPIIIDVFLKGTGFPSEIKRLQTETRQLLEEFSSENGNIKFSFINPIEDDATRASNIQQLSQRGLTPMQIRIKDGSKTSNEIAFPWALASYNGVTVKVPLVKNKIGENQQELISNSVQHLEYTFADAFNKLLYPKNRKIAILKGNGQLDDQYLFDFVKTLRDYYYIAPFTLDSVSDNANKTLTDLKAFDLIISAKPTMAFTEEEKLVLDQYTMNGGKSLWLIDAVSIEKDSLYNTGENIAIPRDLNLTDFFFKYGLRINSSLVSTPYSAPITLAMGDGNDAQLQDLRWPYSPLASASSSHPIVNNINYVMFDFASPIDTLKNNISKSILLESAPLSKTEGVPKTISLDIVTKEQDPKSFNQGNMPLAVLLEGEFTSVYKNRVKPFSLSEEKNKSIPTKMVVIADGDIIKNEMSRNGPVELGFDRRSLRTYGNKEFLLNTVNYLLDDSGLINIRSKEIKLAFLDQQKIANSKSKWQLINIVLPLVILGLFGFCFNYIRKKKYST